MTKIIESATVFFEGDRSVGIPSTSFVISLYIDPTDYDNGPDKTTGITAVLRDVRQKISELYELIQGDKPSGVMFDFEVDAQNEAEKKFDDEQARLDQEWDNMNKTPRPCSEDI
jgi:hypothetical protein